MTGITILLALTVFLALAGGFIYLITVYNSLVRLQNDVDKAWSNIDVLLKQRHDELPKLIETCKGYMQYEQRTLRQVIEARSAYLRASTIPQKAQADTIVGGALKTLFAVAEKYPDLKADSNFRHLQDRISDLEEKIADRREFFNDDVNTYNIRIRQFPDVFIASLMSMRHKEMFRVAEQDRQDVAVSLAT